MTRGFVAGRQGLGWQPGKTGGAAGIARPESWKNGMRKRRTAAGVRLPAPHEAIES